MNRYIDADKYRKDLLSAYDDVSMEFEVLDRQPMVQAISLDKVKQAREEMKEHSYSLKCFNEDVFDEDERVVDLDDVLIILDKLIEEVEDGSKEDN